MSCCLNAGFAVSGSSSDVIANNGVKASFNICPSMESLQFKESNSKDYFFGKTLDVSDQRAVTSLNIRAPILEPVNAQSSVCIPRSLRWWEKSLQSNMLEIESAQELVDALSTAGNRLAIIDFYSPGCGGCKALHPKICRLAESNPNALFLKVNQEKHKAICNALNVHVLPFFRMYRGEKGKVCSFSCTNATIKKFKDALANYGSDQSGFGSLAKGLDDSELLALASNGLINNFVPKVIVEEGSAIVDALSKEGNAIVMA